MTDPKLTPAQERALMAMTEEWNAGYDVGLPNGNSASVLCDKGYLVGRSDPATWGRHQYRLTPAGATLRAKLAGEPKEHSMGFQVVGEVLEDGNE
jgi:hypothetical protein